MSASRSCISSFAGATGRLIPASSWRPCPQLRGERTPAPANAGPTRPLLFNRASRTNFAVVRSPTPGADGSAALRLIRRAISRLDADAHFHRLCPGYGDLRQPEHIDPIPAPGSDLCGLLLSVDQAAAA